MSDTIARALALNAQSKANFVEEVLSALQPEDGELIREVDSVGAIEDAGIYNINGVYYLKNKSIIPIGENLQSLIFTPSLDELHSYGYDTSYIYPTCEITLEIGGYDTHTFILSASGSDCYINGVNEDIYIYGANEDIYSRIVTQVTSLTGNAPTYIKVISIDDSMGWFVKNIVTSNIATKDDITTALASIINGNEVSY